MVKHVHCELIKAWADGAEIEFLELSDGEGENQTAVWIRTDQPAWWPSRVYRVALTKPSVDWCPGCRPLCNCLRPPGKWPRLVE